MGKFEESKQSGIHKWLNSLEGSWEGITKTWFEPEKLADESPMKGTIKPILGGKYIMHEYSSTMQGKPYEGISIYGYDLRYGESAESDARFQAINVDSFHTGTGIITQEGEPGNKKFSALGHYYWHVSPEEVQKWGWRTELDLQDDNTLVITIYNITPDGQSAKGVETVYKRVK